MYSIGNVIGYQGEHGHYCGFGYRYIVQSGGAGLLGDVLIEQRFAFDMNTTNNVTISFLDSGRTFKVRLKSRNRQKCIHFVKCLAKADEITIENSVECGWLKCVK